MKAQTVGAMIAKLRKEKNATQEELASKVGVSSQAVSKWENGGRRVEGRCFALARIMQSRTGL